MIANETELYHYGIKGQKWGVRRWQYSDGTLTPEGNRRYNNPSKSSLSRMKVKELLNNQRTVLTGRQYSDTYLKKGITFSRIQSYKDFEKHPFYATYKKQDIDKYMGLFGSNIKRRAVGKAKHNLKEAKKTNDVNAINKAKKELSEAKKTKAYQLKITNTKKLKVPSDAHAGDIVSNLLKDKKFKDNTIYSIDNAKKKGMIRPNQRILFKQAQNALKQKRPLSNSEKIAVYKAINLTLVNHDEKEVYVQNKFYSALKKKGYDALLDYNDKDYSSYKAKRPMIVFNLDSVKLKSVTETNPKIVKALNRKYTRKTTIGEIPSNTLGVINKFANKTVSECSSYLNNKVDNYLNGNNRRK